MKVAINIAWPESEIISTVLLQMPRQPAFAAVLRAQFESGGRLSLRDAAQLMCLSTSRFSHVFSRAFKIPFRVAAVHVRMALAAHYLEVSSVRISAISEKLQFSDLKSFERAFHKYFGMSPTAFRKGRR